MALAFALPGTLAATAVKVSPLVVMNVSDSYTRRPQEAERVVGALLGAWTDNGLEVRNSYAVPHTESDGQIAIDVEYFRHMLELQLRAAPKDVLVGWYSTGSCIAPTDTLVHEFVARSCSAPPVHLVVDPSMANPRACVTAWMGSPLVMQSQSQAQEQQQRQNESAVSSGSSSSIGTHFQQIPVELRTADAERVGTSLLQRTQTGKQSTDLQSLDSTLAKLERLLDRAHSFADEVCNGQREPDTSIGRYLSETLNAVPHLSQAQLDSLFDESLQDHGMVLMLAQMTRTNTALAERLNSNAN